MAERSGVQPDLQQGWETISNTESDLIEDLVYEYQQHQRQQIPHLTNA